MDSVSPTLQFGQSVGAARVINDAKQFVYIPPCPAGRQCLQGGLRETDENNDEFQTENISQNLDENCLD